jgi:hypothetical protein
LGKNGDFYRKRNKLLTKEVTLQETGEGVRFRFRFSHEDFTQEF